MSLTILQVAYPFARVRGSSAGGAEQVLSALDRAVIRAGHRSLVLAQAGSEVAGELIPVPPVPGPLDVAAHYTVHGSVRRLLDEVLRRERVDLIHFHGVDFADYLPASGPTVVVTLHLPAGYYRPAAFAARTDLTLVCVSESQRKNVPVPEAEIIPNGVDLEVFGVRRRGRRYGLGLGRVCPEKGFARALDAARSAHVPFLLAGRVFPYPVHQRHFADEICPRLDRRRRFVGPVDVPGKVRLLAGARCLVVPSLVPETSSLVAMEALASGTPVVARRIGAMPELIEQGRNGFLVDEDGELGPAMRDARELSVEECRTTARERCDGRRMANRYLQLYARVAGKDRRLSPRLEVERVDNRDRLEALASEWSALADRAARSTPFQRPEWILPWTRAFGGEALRTVAVWQRGRLVGLAPLQAVEWEGRRLLLLLGTGVSDVLDVLVDPSLAAEVRGALAGAIASWRDGWDVFRAEALPAESELSRLPWEGAVSIAVDTARQSLSLPSAPEGLSTVVPAQWLRSRRYALRKASRRMRLEWVEARTANVSSMLEDLFVLHGQRWQGRGEAGVLADPRLRAMHHEVARGFLARGELRLGELRLDGRVAAVLYAFAGHRRTCAYLGGFDASMEKHSPGNLLFLHAIEQAIAEGHEAFDFLRGDEGYKAAWGAQPLPAEARELLPAR